LRSGWVNIDLSTNITPVSIPSAAGGPRTMYINHDLRRGLPLPENSCEMIYSSHFFEHLDRTDGYRLMKDAYRALRPGGVFRIVIPNFAACFQAYVERDEEFFSAIDLEALYSGESAPPLSLIDYLNYAVYQFGEHRCLYDEEKLRLLLHGIGFRTAERASFDPAVDVDIPLRTRYSLYLHAEK
jgi:SAM-dependent methyltransferase